MTDITDAPIFYWHESPGNRFRVDVADFDEAAECPHCVPVYSAETVDRLRARVAELEAERNIAVQMLADWCMAVANNGTGWDDWDEHYKEAAYREGPLRSLIDAAMTEGN